MGVILGGQVWVACEVSGVNGILIVSEANLRERKSLQKNLRGAACNFQVVPAFSDKPLYYKEWKTQDTPAPGSERIETIPYARLKSYRPTVIIVDCEGCFDDILHSDKLDLSNVHTIILENDGNSEQNRKIRKTLLEGTTENVDVKNFESVECRDLTKGDLDKGDLTKKPCFWEVLQRSKTKSSSSYGVKTKNTC